MSSTNTNVNNNKNSNTDIILNDVLIAVLSGLQNVQIDRPIKQGTSQDSEQLPTLSAHPGTLNTSPQASLTGSSLSLAEPTKPVANLSSQIGQGLNQILNSTDANIAAIPSSGFTTSPVISKLSAVTSDSPNSPSMEPVSSLLGGIPSGLSRSVTSGLGPSIPIVGPIVNPILNNITATLNSDDSNAEESEESAVITDSQDIQEEPDSGSSRISASQIKLLKELVNERVRKAMKEH